MRWQANRFKDKFSESSSTEVEKMIISKDLDKSFLLNKKKVE